MLVTYNAPNRAHHYGYAAALARGGNLQRFVTAFSRFSPRAPLPEVEGRLLRADHVQNFYLASLRLRLPAPLSEELTYLSKIWLDRCSTPDALRSDAFLCYSGAGLRTLQALKSTRTVGLVEAVNSHVLVQERILREEHDRLGLPLQGFHRREVARRVREFELADGVICPSTFTRQSFLEMGLDPARIRTVPFGVVPAEKHDPVDRPSDSLRVLFVGQINLRKGLRYLLEAFKKLRHPKKELWIVGPKTAQTGIDDLTLPDETRFLGVLKGAELAHAYQSCHVFVLPTIEEGMALVMGEALSYGLPVIATANSGAVDLFKDGSTGFIVPIRSPEAITEKLQLLADDRNLLAEMSHRAEISAQGHQGWGAASQQFVRTVNDFAEMPKP